MELLNQRVGPLYSAARRCRASCRASCRPGVPSGDCVDRESACVRGGEVKGKVKCADREFPDRACERGRGSKEKRESPPRESRYIERVCAHTVVAGLRQAHRCVAESYRARIKFVRWTAPRLATAYARAASVVGATREHKLGNQQWSTLASLPTRDGSIRMHGAELHATCRASECMELSYMQLHGQKRFFIGAGGAKNRLHTGWVGGGRGGPLV